MPKKAIRYLLRYQQKRGPCYSLNLFTPSESECGSENFLDVYHLIFDLLLSFLRLFILPKSFHGPLKKSDCVTIGPLSIKMHCNFDQFNLLKQLIIK